MPVCDDVFRRPWVAVPFTPRYLSPVTPDMLSTYDGVPSPQGALLTDRTTYPGATPDGLFNCRGGTRAVTTGYIGGGAAQWVGVQASIVSGCCRCGWPPVSDSGCCEDDSRSRIWRSWWRAWFGGMQSEWIVGHARRDSGPARRFVGEDALRQGAVELELRKNKRNVKGKMRRGDKEECQWQGRIRKVDA